jgi:hypothetical protein
MAKVIKQGGTDTDFKLEDLQNADMPASYAPGNWDTAYGWGDWSTGVDKAFVDALNVDADTVDGNHANSFVQTANNSTLNSDSRNTRGVTRLFRRDDDLDYSVQHHWTGSRWYLRGYSGDNFHAECLVGYAFEADRLDGIDSSGFLRSDTSDTANGLIDFVGNLRTRSIRSRGTELLIGAGETWSQLEANITGGEALRLGGEDGIEIVSTPDNWSSGWSGRNQGNLVDRSGNSSLPGNLDLDGHLKLKNSSSSAYDLRIQSNYDWDGWCRFIDGDDEVVAAIGRNGEMYIGGAGGSSGAHKVWHEGNDGSGSGLDADRVDGIHAGGFIRSNANDQVSAHTEWQDGKQIRFGNSADFRIWHDGNDAWLRSYHHGGNIYLQTEDNGGTNRTQLALYSGSNSYVQARYNGSERLRTTNAGIDVTGEGTADDWVATSDIRFKKDIETIQEASALVEAIRGVRYTRRDDDDGHRRIGVIAQEVEQVLPELVFEHEDPGTGETHKTVSYTKLTAVLLEAIKELSERVEALENGAS